MTSPDILGRIGKIVRPVTPQEALFADLEKFRCERDSEQERTYRFVDKRGNAVLTIRQKDERNQEGTDYRVEILDNQGGVKFSQEGSIDGYTGINSKGMGGFLFILYDFARDLAQEKSRLA